jgi:N-acetylmuramoyl-L-alanine amidase CwlA
MSVDYFPHGITKSAFTCLSCRHYYNVRVKYHKMNTFIQDEIVNKILYEHNMDFSGPTIITSPGAVWLPTPFDTSIFTYPCLKQFQNPSNLVIHLTCNHRSMINNLSDIDFIYF